MDLGCPGAKSGLLDHDVPLVILDHIQWIRTVLKRKVGKGTPEEAPRGRTKAAISTVLLESRLLEP